MAAVPAKETDHRPPRELEKCLARLLADTLAEERARGAVEIARGRQKISVATLGRADVDKLTERITEKLTPAQSAVAENHWSLLAGKNDCATCNQPLSEAERKKITIRTEGNATTIARVTCPTAPKFWRWRHLPVPHIEPRA